MLDDVPCPHCGTPNYEIPVISKRKDYACVYCAGQFAVWDEQGTRILALDTEVEDDGDDEDDFWG